MPCRHAVGVLYHFQALDHTQAAGGFKKKNFPICFPMWHHDISGDIPEKSRRVVREMFVCWWVSAFHPLMKFDVQRCEHCQQRACTRSASC